MKPIDLTPAKPAQRFRVVDERDAGPIPYTEANDQYRDAWREARLRYVQLLASLSGPYIERFLLPSRGSQLTHAEIRGIRNRLAEATEHANAMLAALDHAVDLTRRAVPDE